MGKSCADTQKIIAPLNSKGALSKAFFYSWDNALFVLLSLLSVIFRTQISELLTKPKDIALFANPLLCTLSHPKCLGVCLCCTLHSVSQLRWCFPLSFFLYVEKKNHTPV